MKTFAMGSSTTGRAVISYSSTEVGTKRKASIGGYDSIGYISTINNMYIQTHVKESGKWVEV